MAFDFHVQFLNVTPIGIAVDPVPNRLTAVPLIFAVLSSQLQLEKASSYRFLSPSPDDTLTTTAPAVAVLLMKSQFAIAIALPEQLES